MKKVIKGRIYDTEKAKFLASWENYASRRDFNHMEESLYQKKTGEFFLHGEGGPSTKYAVMVDQNCWSGGERIMPMTYEEAQKWAENHLDGDEYEEIFGEVIEETGEKQVVSISISSAKWETAKREAAKRGIGISEYIESLL